MKAKKPNLSSVLWVPFGAEEQFLTGIILSTPASKLQPRWRKLCHQVVSPRVQGTNQWLISLYTTTARYIITFIIIISAETVLTTTVITVLYFLISCNSYSNFEGVFFKSVSRSFVFNSLKMFSFSLGFLVSVLVLFFFIIIVWRAYVTGRI